VSTGAIENRRNAAGFRSRLASPATAKAIGIAALVAPFAGIPLAILIDRTTTSGPSVAGFYLVFGIVFAAVGIVVARRQPRNPIGWLLLGASLAMTLGSVGSPRQAPPRCDRRVRG
jgi:hypothetical protein